MDFNFDTGAIYGGLASLDVSSLPPLGSGPANILTIVGSGALTLPMGTAAERPAAAGGTDIAGMFRYNTTGNVLEYYNGTVWATLAVGGGTVTSVALTAPSIFTVSGSPVTTTGTLDFALNTQSANTVFAGPASGGAATPTFRGLVFDDISGAILQLYKENPSTPTAPVASGTNAVAIGSGSTATATAGFAVGAGSDARIAGMKAYANGSFATAGGAQHGVYVARNITTDATLTELFLDGSSLQLVMPASSLFVFDIMVAGRRTDVTGGGAGYRFVGVARIDATAGSVTFVSTPSKTVIGETNNSWDAAVSVDTATGALRVRVVGEAAKTIRWVATIQTTEVTS